MITLESCDRLFASLRQHGFEVGVDAHLALADLWLNFLSRGQDLATDKQRLARLIGPLVCATSHDQQIFPRLFDAWWTAEHTAPGPQPQPFAASLLAIPAHSRWPWLLGFALLLSLILYWLMPRPVVDNPATTAPNGSQQGKNNASNDGSTNSGTSSTPNIPNESAREHAKLPPKVAVLEQRIRQRLSAMHEEGYDTAKLAKFQAESERLLGQLTDSTLGSTASEIRQLPNQTLQQNTSQEWLNQHQQQLTSSQQQWPIVQELYQLDGPQRANPNLEPAAGNAVLVEERLDRPANPLLDLDTRLGQWHCQQQLAELQQRIALLGLEARILSGPERLYQRVYPYLILLPLLIALPFGLWFQRLANALEQRRAQGSTQVQHIVIPIEDQELYASADFRRTLQAMGVHRVVGSRQIDVAATIRATGQRGGIISPVQGQSRRLPEYLMLVDRHEPDSHGARMAEVLAHQLSQGGLFVDVLYFDRDPRHCVDKDGLSHFIARDLQQRFHDHRLLICSDGSSFIDPFTLEPLPWLDFLNTWQHRTLLSPSEFWGFRERALAETGLWTLPMTESGLAQFMEFVLLESPPNAPDTTVNRFPTLLLERPNYWFTRAKPDDRLLARLLEQLRAYLGDDFTWLAACAIYPSLHWDITLLLGQSLYGDSGEGRELRLLSLVRLPWFNRGFMPLWLRQVLIETLPAPLEHKLRQLLRSLLADGTLSGNNPGFKLEVHRKLASKPDPHSKANAPHRDQVFLHFLAKSRSQRLALRLPRGLLALLFHRADPFNGPRWFWLGLLTLGACLGIRLLMPTPVVGFAYRLPQFVGAEPERAELGPYFLVTALSEQTIGTLRNADQSPLDYLSWLRNYLQEQANGHYVVMLKPPSSAANGTWKNDTDEDPLAQAFSIDRDTLQFADLPPLCLNAPIAAATLLPGERKQLLVGLAQGEIRRYDLVDEQWVGQWSENLGRPVFKLGFDPTGCVVLAETDYLCLLDASSGKNLSLSYQPNATRWADEVQWAADLDQHRLVLAIYDRIYPDFLIEQPSQGVGARRHLGSAAVGERLDFEWAALPLPPPYQISWAFGEGSVGWGPRTQHLYPQAGTYTVKLTYTHHLTSESLKRELKIAVDAHADATLTEQAQIKPLALDPDSFRKEVMRLLDKRVPIASLALADDGMFALLDGSGQVWIWNDSATPPLSAISFAARTRGLHALAFSPDGDTLALGGDNGLLAMCDLRTGKNVFSDDKEVGTYRALGFLGNEQLIGAGTYHTVRFWRSTRLDLAPWEELDVEQSSVQALAFAPSGQHLAVVGQDSVRIWDTKGQPIHTFRPGPLIAAVAFSPKGNLCAAACVDRSLRIWDLYQPKAPALVIERKAAVNNLGFIKGGHLALAEESAIVLLDLTTRKEQQLRSRLGQITAIATHNSSSLILVGDDSDTLFLWNGESVYEGLFMPDQGWFFIDPQGNFDAAEKTMSQLAKGWNLTDFSFEAYRQRYHQSFLKRAAKR